MTIRTRTRSIAVALACGVTVAAGIGAMAASDTGAERRAHADAQGAQKALAKHKVAQAIAKAEAAVAASPRTASYRTLLGQAYLAAGRFTSALGALNDAVALDPADGAAALHLALAQIATGDWKGAQATLASHEQSIAPSDRGLATALAGDPDRAVQILTAAAREPGASPKTRQNLALSLALAGRWSAAKTVAALDVSPAEVDRRIVQWASFAKPRTSYDQVAALLGVVPVEDAGQPERLALRESAPVMAAVAQPIDPVDAFIPGKPSEQQVAAAQASVTAEAAPIVAPAAETETVVATAPVAAPVSAVVAPQPAPAVVAAPRPAAVHAVVRPNVRPVPVKAVAWAPVKGNFYVQLGAYQSSGVAKDAWQRIARRHALAGYSPYAATINARGRAFYRLAVGGFARPDAVALCARVRAKGGVCFVRAGAGDAIASWSRPGVQLAMR